MNKIICDICGTSYQESAECCPICGCTKEAAAGLLAEEAVEEISTNTGAAPRRKEIFDFDEVNAEPKEEEDEEEEDYDEEEEEDEEEEAPRHNTFVVILLTILIAGLLLAAGFIFVRYFLPNMQAEETAPTTAAVQETESVAQETGVPCEVLTMLNTSVAELNAEGQQFLLNIKTQPEDTTDKIIYTVADESIATVSEDGKITAVSEGETNVYISCGEHSVLCPVIVKYVEETVPPTTEAQVVETAPQETVPQETAGEETVPAETAPADTGLKNVTLKLKKTDIMLGVYYQFTLELDCDLEQNEVEWSSEHPHIAKVDENGVVTAVKSGTTIVTAKYGDQKVDCWVRCS